MTSTDDKLLGEKLQYYYSSSEGEDEDSEKEDKEEGESSIPENVGEVELSSDGSTVNTGIIISMYFFCKSFVFWKFCMCF